MSKLQKERASKMTKELRSVTYGNCKGKPWSEAKRNTQLNKGVK